MMVLKLMVIMLFHVTGATAHCDPGELRLVGGSSPNEGRVEVCACRPITSCSWGTVCDDRWDGRDAQVVCRQLGYRPDGAMALSRTRYGQGQGRIVLDDVQCDGSEATLLECNHDEYHNCLHIEDAGVKYNRDENIIKNISASITSTTLYTALITWSPQNTTQYQPNSYEVECFSRQHHIRMMVNNTTFNLELAGLLPFMSYTCCVSTIYGSYTARRVCTEIATIQPPTSQPSPTVDISTNKPTVINESSTIQPIIRQNLESSFSQPSETPVIPSNGGPTVMSGDISTNKPSSESSTTQPSTCQTQGSSFSASSSANTIGGVLGFIIAILLILLALSGAAIVYLLRLRLKSSVAADRSSTDVPLRANMSYTTTPSHSTTSGPHATQATRPGHGDQTGTESETTDEYSRIGPSYTYVTAQVRRQQPATVAGRNQVSASAGLSERYEFSEAHLTAAGGGDGDDGAYGVLGGEVGGDVQRHNM